MSRSCNVDMGVLQVWVPQGVLLGKDDLELGGEIQSYI